MKWLYVLQGLLFVKTHPILLLASSLSSFLPFSSIFKKSVLLLGLFACLSLCHLSCIYWAIICPWEMHMQSHMKAFFLLALNITQYIRCLSSMNTPFSFTKTQIAKTRVHSKKGVFFFSWPFGGACFTRYHLQQIACFQTASHLNSVLFFARGQNVLYDFCSHAVLEVEFLKLLDEASCRKLFCT